MSCVPYVQVLASPGPNKLPLRCQWLGHESYRCGACRKEYFRVTRGPERELVYPERCTGCKAEIHASLATDEWPGGRPSYIGVDFAKPHS